MSKYDYDDEKEVVVNKKGGLLGKIVALVLGFVLGIVGCLGGIVGGGYYLAKKKTPKDILSLAELDYSAYLTEEYATKTVWDMLGSTKNALSAFSNGSGTFGDLAAISPVVKRKVEEFAASAKAAYGVELNQDGAMLNVPFSQLNVHIRDCIKNTYASDMMIKLGGGNKVLTALCYGVEGEDYTVNENGEIQMLEGKTQMTIGEFSGDGLNERLKRVPIETLMTVDTSDKTTCALVYGEAHHYTVNEDGSVTMNQLYYTLVETTEGLTLYDEYGEVVPCNILPLTAETYKITFEDGPVQYLSKTEYVEPTPEDKTEDKSDGETPNEETPEGDEQTQAVSDEVSTKLYAYRDEKCAAPVRFKKTTVGDLQDDSAGVINNIALKDALGVTPASHGVLIALACGEENVDFEYVYDSETGEKTDVKLLTSPRTIGDLRGNSRAMIDDIYLTSVITPKHDNKIIMYLLYGREGVHYELRPDKNDPSIETPTPLQKQVAVYNDLVYNEYGEPIANATASGAAYTQYDTDGTTKLATYTLTAIAGKTRKITLPLADGETEPQTADAPLYYVSDENGKEVKYTRTQMRDLTGDSKLLSNFTSRLTLSDVVDVQDNKILKHLTGVTIAELPAAVNELTIEQVFYEDMHYTDKDGNFTKADGTLLNEGEAPVLRPTWKYLLRSKDTGEYTYTYKVTQDMNTMVENIEYNMQNTSLNDMNDDKVIVTHESLRIIDIKQDVVNAAENAEGYEGTFSNISFDNGETPQLGLLTVNQMLVYLEFYMILYH